MELISALISSLSGGSEGLPGIGDYVKQSFGNSAIGKGLSALEKDDATASSVFNAAQSGMAPSRKDYTQMQALQQGVVGAQQPTYTQPQYMSGIPSLLQGYGSSSQGILPLIGAR